MGNLDWAIPAPLEKERSPADSRITQRRSSRPSTALLPWSPSTGTGGRHPPETVVAFNRKPWSPWTGARTTALVAPENLPEVRQPLRNMDDMRMLLNSLYPASEVSMHLTTARWRFMPAARPFGARD
jgi:hypothetical protein